MAFREIRLKHYPEGAPVTLPPISELLPSPIIPSGPPPTPVAVNAIPKFEFPTIHPLISVQPARLLSSAPPSSAQPSCGPSSTAQPSSIPRRRKSPFRPTSYLYPYVRPGRTPAPSPGNPAGESFHSHSIRRVHVQVNEDQEPLVTRRRRNAAAAARSRAQRKEKERSSAEIIRDLEQREEKALAERDFYRAERDRLYQLCTGSGICPDEELRSDFCKSPSPQTGTEGESDWKPEYGTEEEAQGAGLKIT